MDNGQCTYVATVTLQGTVSDQEPLSISWLFPLGCLLWQEFVLWRRKPVTISLLRLKKFWSIPALTVRREAAQHTLLSAKFCTEVDRSPWQCRCCRDSFFTLRLSPRVTFQQNTEQQRVPLNSYHTVKKHTVEYRKSIMGRIEDVLVKIHRWHLIIRFKELRGKTSLQL